MINESKRRAELRALIQCYGAHRMTLGDNALEELTNIIRGSDISREDLAAITAFAVRRLFNKKADLVRFSAN